MTGSREAGSAVVEFVMVGGLVMVLFAGLLQLAVALHVRNTLIDCAAEGARFAAMADRSLDAGAQRAEDLAAMSLSAALGVRAEAREIVLDGVAVVEIRVEARLPVLGLLGPAGALEVTGHALQEGP